MIRVVLADSIVRNKDRELKALQSRWGSDARQHQNLRCLEDTSA